jgi:hypothetical protein
LIGQPKPRPEFALAGKADESEIRRLLHENPMRGRISLSLEREPDYFSDAQVPGEAKQTILAHENGCLACMGTCTVRERFVNGRPMRVGYLGGLRLDSAFQGRFDIVRRGYAFFKEVQSSNPADFYFTSIAAGNERARGFLERGLPGMPKYEFMGEFISVVIRTARASVPRSSLQSHARVSVQSVLRINEHNVHYQLSPSWSVDEVEHLYTLGLEGTVALGARDHIHASAALWDQRNYKQTVIRGYSPALAFIRPAANIAAWIFGQPSLPRPDTILASAFITQLVAEPGNSAPLTELIDLLRRTVARREIEFLTIGFASNDPRLEVVRSKFRHREYQTRLYLVRWPEFGGPASELDDRVLAPEVALL